MDMHSPYVTYLYCMSFRLLLMCIPWHKNMMLYYRSWYMYDHIRPYLVSRMGELKGNIYIYIYIQIKNK